MRLCLYPQNEGKTPIEIRIIGLEYTPSECQPCHPHKERCTVVELHLFLVYARWRGVLLFGGSVVVSSISWKEAGMDKENKANVQSSIKKRIRLAITGGYNASLVVHSGVSVQSLSQ